VKLTNAWVGLWRLGTCVISLPQHAACDVWVGQIQSQCLRPNLGRLTGAFAGPFYV